MVVNTVIFDMDGTLLDSSATVPAAYAAAIYDISGLECTHEEVIGAYGAGPAAALIGSFIGRPGTKADVECWLGHLEARLSETIIYDGILDAIEDLRSAGLNLAVFTGATRRAAELQLAHAGVAEHIQVLVGSDEIEGVKPAPDGIHLACRRLAVEPSGAAYVGDALNDLRCARAAGSVPVAAGWGHLYQPDNEYHIIANHPAELATLLRS